VTLSASPKTIGQIAAPAVRALTTATRALAVGALVVSLGACVHHRHQKKKIGEAVTMAPSKVTTIGVNSYLWRATLDTLSFMPLASADPFGGVIITDWFQPPTAQGERFKATAYILGRQLRADGVRVVVFRQVQQGAQWVDASVSPATTGEIENKVLARARELRAQSASN